MHRPPSFHRRRLLAACATLACALLTACGKSQQPLLLLITADTTRADHLGAYGDDRGLTPNLDRLASEGLRFDRFYAPSAYTLPSVASLMTGRYPEEVGIFANRSMFSGAETTLAEVFRLNGWHTAGVVSNYVLHQGSGIDVGFDEYDDHYTRKEANRDQPERIASETTDAALSMLDRMREKEAAGLFLWVHFQDPHGPYLPPDGYRERGLERARSAPDGTRELPVYGINAFGAIPEYQAVGEEREVAFYRAGYAGEIAYLDEEIGRLLAGVRERGLLRDAAVVFTADHGESLGENDYWFAHGEMLTDPLVRIPLLIRAPGLEPGARPESGTLIDLLPTLLALYGIDVPGNPVGRDLLAPGAEALSSPVYAASLKGSARPQYVWIEDDWKYLVTHLPRGAIREQLFAPGDETRSIAGREKERMLRMRNSLRDFRRGLAEPDLPKYQRLTPRDREMLRSLGYLDD